MVRDRTSGRFNGDEGRPTLRRKAGMPAMVQLAKQDPTRVYVVIEGDRPIGRVVAPLGVPILGPGAGTVFLSRCPVGAAA